MPKYGSQVQRSPDGTPAAVHWPPPIVHGMPTPFSLACAGGQPSGSSIVTSNTAASLGGCGSSLQPAARPPATIASVATAITSVQRM